jgi:hypothetical protein
MGCTDFFLCLYRCDHCHLFHGITFIIHNLVMLFLYFQIHFNSIVLFYVTNLVFFRKEKNFEAPLWNEGKYVSSIEVQRFWSTRSTMLKIYLGFWRFCLSFELPTQIIMHIIKQWCFHIFENTNRSLFMKKPKAEVISPSVHWFVLVYLKGSYLAKCSTLNFSNFICFNNVIMVEKTNQKK